jgi:hypothetical protein
MSTSAVVPAHGPAEDTAADPPPYTFDQLDARAKEVARAAWRRAGADDDWWDAVYEDAVTVGALIGIAIGTRTYKSVGGTPLPEPDINFSLYCQGGGACFSGTLDIALLNGAPARLATHVGNDDVLHALAARGQALYDQIALRHLTRRLLGVADDDDGWAGLDEINPDERIDIIANERHYTCRLSRDDDTDDLVVCALNDYVEDFAGWLAAALEAEDEYLNSDEHVDDELRTSECEFDEHGDPW